MISVFPLQREHRNHFPAGFPKELKKESKIDEKQRKVGFRKVSKNVSEKMMEKVSQNEPNGSPKGSQVTPKIDKNRAKSYSRHQPGVKNSRGAPKGGFRMYLGCLLGGFGRI